MSSTHIYIYGPLSFIGVDGKYHYTYRITNKLQNKHYYGVRTSSIDPFLDLGTVYFSSSKIVSPMVRQTPNNFKFKILKCFNTRQEANIHEIGIHEKFKVSENENFYNLAKHTSTMFCPFGNIWITNGVDNKIIGKSDAIPESWRRGIVRKSDFKNVWITDGNINKKWLREVELPYGFVLGRTAKSTKNRIMITDGHSNKLIEHHEPLPKGWRFGTTQNHVRKKRDYKTICITDGKTTKRIRKDLQVPEGWCIGNTCYTGNKTKGTKWITDGIQLKKLNPEHTLPVGWRFGRP
jgi:hypothetical protein